MTALSLAFPIQNLQIGFAVGIGVGVNSLLSKSLGEGNQEAANRTAGNGFILMLMVTALFMLFGVIGVRPYYEMQSTVRETVEGGIVYSQICCLLTAGVFLSILGERLLQATGRTVYTMITQSTGAILNIILDPILIHGWFGAPAMGIAGAAVATVIGQWVSAALVWFFNFRFNPEVQFGARYLRLENRPTDSGGWRSLHRHERYRLRHDVWHESDFAELYRDGHRCLRRVFQAAELLLYAPVWPEQRHHFHHCLQFRR